MPTEPGKYIFIQETQSSDLSSNLATGYGRGPDQEVFYDLIICYTLKIIYLS